MTWLWDFFSAVRNPFMSVQNELTGLSCWLAVTACQEPSIRQPLIIHVFHHPKSFQNPVSRAKQITCCLVLERRVNAPVIHTSHVKMQHET